MVFTGKNPMVDVIPLPYSVDVIESYRILVPNLQRMIGDIVRSKITCIRRRAEGVIPCISYSPPDAFTQQEKSEIEIALKEYNDQYPNRAYSDVYGFL
jgi:hypothetical protein